MVIGFLVHWRVQADALIEVIIRNSELRMHVPQSIDCEPEAFRAAK